MSECEHNLRNFRHEQSISTPVSMHATHTFPTDKKLRRKWMRAVSLRRKNYKWKASDRVCSAHFPGGRKYEGNNIPAVFPRRDLNTGDIVWPVDISGLLQEKSFVAETEKNKPTATEEVKESDASGKNTVYNL